LTDDFGNKYKAVEFGFADQVIGQLRGEATLYPNKPVTDVLVFEAPIARANSLILDLPASQIGSSGSIKFKIDRKMWDKSDKRPPETPAKTDKKKPK
jgi:hypothetical protein